MGSSAGAPDRASAIVWCEKRGREAVVTTVRLDAGAKVLHYVQWCSLAGIDLACDERCILAPAAEREPPAPDMRSTTE
jgi:hypothetical protein